MVFDSYGDGVDDFAVRSDNGHGDRVARLRRVVRRHRDAAIVVKRGGSGTFHGADLGAVDYRATVVLDGNCGLLGGLGTVSPAWIVVDDERIGGYCVGIGVEGCTHNFTGGHTLRNGEGAFFGLSHAREVVTSLEDLTLGVGPHNLVLERGERHTVELDLSSVPHLRRVGDGVEVRNVELHLGRGDDGEVHVVGVAETALEGRCLGSPVGLLVAAVLRVDPRRIGLELLTLVILDKHVEALVLRDCTLRDRTFGHADRVAAVGVRSGVARKRDVLGVVSEKPLGRGRLLRVVEACHLVVIGSDAFVGELRDNDAVALGVRIGITVVHGAGRRVGTVTGARLKPHPTGNRGLIRFGETGHEGRIGDRTCRVLYPLTARAGHVALGALSHENAGLLHVGADKRELAQVRVGNRVHKRAGEEATILADHRHGVASFGILVFGDPKTVVLTGRCGVGVAFAGVILPARHDLTLGVLFKLALLVDAKVERVGATCNAVTVGINRARGLRRVDGRHRSILVEPAQVHGGAVGNGEVVALERRRVAVVVDNLGRTRKNTTRVGGVDRLADVTALDGVGVDRSERRGRICGGSSGHKRRVERASASHARGAENRADGESCGPAAPQRRCCGGRTVGVPRTESIKNHECSYQ